MAAMGMPVTSELACAAGVPQTDVQHMSPSQMDAGRQLNFMFFALLVKRQGYINFCVTVAEGRITAGQVDLAGNGMDAACVGFTLLSVGHPCARIRAKQHK